MTTRSQREFLKVQLLDTQRLQGLAAGHPLMSVAFSKRAKELESQIQALPLGNKEARTVLFFSGEPVQGSMGIDASFAGHVLVPFQNMVMADYADRFHGVVGSRGRRVSCRREAVSTHAPKSIYRPKSDAHFPFGQSKSASQPSPAASPVGFTGW